MMATQAIEGHEDVVQAFRQVLARGRLAHAYLLIGPRGVGKRLFARVLAQALLCETRDEIELHPCGTCDGCVQVKAGTHPDVLAIGRGEGEQDLPIEAVRGLIRGLGFKPDRGRYKIAIVDDADELNDASANCFLKCLEEPPPRSLLLLIGSSADLQLATIRSRCQIVRFRPLPRAVVARVLLRNGVTEDAAHADRLAAMSGGSLERAVGLADPELWAFRDVLAKALAAPRVDGAELAESVHSQVESAGKEAPAKRTRAKLLIGMAAELLDDSLRAAAGLDASAEDALTRPAIDRLATQRPAETICRLIEKCLDADYRIDRMASIPLVVESWADEMARTESVHG